MSVNRSEYANSVFEQPWWLDAVAEGKWGEILVKEGDEIVARLPYVLDGGVISNPTYTQTLGIWMAPALRAFQNGNGHLRRQKEVIAELLSQLPKHKSVDLTLDSAQGYILPFRWHGYRIEPTFSYRIKDLSDPAAIFERMGKSAKRNFKQAEKKLTVDTDCKDLDILIRLQSSTFARQNRSVPIEEALTRRVMQAAMDAGCGRLMVTYDAEGNAHSASFFVYDKNVCYYLLSGQDPQYKNDGSQNLLLCKAIEFAATVSGAFDFEGSMIEGIEHFFAQFGGEQVINYRVCKQSLLRELMDVLKPRIKRLLGYKN